MELTEILFWRRVDQIGLDSCRVFRLDDGWRIEGAAVFEQAGEPVQLSYEVGTDALWVVRRARVTGYRGRIPVDLSVRVYAQGAWTLNHRSQPAVRACVDFDLGFSPAARLLALRRRAVLRLRTASSEVAVLSFADEVLLRQDTLALPTPERAVFEQVPPCADSASNIRHAALPRRTAFSPAAPGWP